jgi:hypothetical protein
LASERSSEGESPSLSCGADFKANGPEITTVGDCFTLNPPNFRVDR